MRFGCCVPIGSFVPGGGTKMDPTQFGDHLVGTGHQLEQAGCDFTELTVAVVSPEEPDSAFRPVQQALTHTRMLPECFNSFVPADLRLVGPERDWSRIEAFLATSTARVAEVHGEIIVFGSGAARNVPDGYSREKAEEELVEFLNCAAINARSVGGRIAIEPLNGGESNILNSVEEATALARRVNQAEIGVLADFYHMMEESEPLKNIPAAGDRLLHVHVADSARLYPGSGSYDYAGFNAALQAAHYDARVSVECRWGNYTVEPTASIRFLRRAWKRSLAPGS